MTLVVTYNGSLLQERAFFVGDAPVSASSPAVALVDRPGVFLFFAGENGVGFAHFLVFPVLFFPFFVDEDGAQAGFCASQVDKDGLLAEFSSS